MQINKPAVSPKLAGIINRASTAAAVATGAVLMSSTVFAADETISLGAVGVGGLTTPVAGVFAIKAAPKFLMWGYGQLMGFIRK